MIEVLFFVVIFFGVFLQSSVGFGTVVTMPLGNRDPFKTAR